MRRTWHDQAGTRHITLEGKPVNPHGKYLLRLDDGRDEPIKDLSNATRVILVDKDTVGAEDITFAHY